MLMNALTVASAANRLVTSFYLNVQSLPQATKRGILCARIVRWIINVASVGVKATIPTLEII